MFVALSSLPSIPLEPAPVTAWLAGELVTDEQSRLGFWGADDRYYLCISSLDGRVHWFVGEGAATAPTSADQGVIRIDAWRDRRAARAGRPILWGRAHRRAGAPITTILAGRAGRSLRWPA
jgi:hypothetical protein